jgi:hypothetical protein
MKRNGVKKISSLATLELRQTGVEIVLEAQSATTVADPCDCLRADTYQKAPTIPELARKIGM